jgi:hypothetical protein
MIKIMMMMMMEIKFNDHRNSQSLGNDALCNQDACEKKRAALETNIMIITREKKKKNLKKSKIYPPKSN